MSWQYAAQQLWGDDWIAPMAEVLDINRRTIERWRAGEGAPNVGLQNELKRIGAGPGARAVGVVLRRLARGETVADIERDVRTMQLAVSRVAADMGKYRTIPVLASEEVQQ